MNAEVGFDGFGESGEFGGWREEIGGTVENGAWEAVSMGNSDSGFREEGSYFTERLCSPMKRKSPAKTLVGVNPRTTWSGGLMKTRIAPAWRKALHRCS